jgi:hypothetical protein
MIELTPNIHMFLRDDWGARRPDFNRLEKQGWDAHEAFLHHSDDSNAEAINHLEEQFAKMRSIQDFHMDVRGWADIGYHFVVMQPYGDIPYARIFQGRGRNLVPAAQQDHNTGTLAVCVVGDFRTDHLMDNTRYALEVLLDRYNDALRTLGGHGDVFPTECPGSNIRSAIPTIAGAVNLAVYKR